MVNAGVQHTTGESRYNHPSHETLYEVSTTFNQVHHLSLCSSVMRQVLPTFKNNGTLGGALVPSSDAKRTKLILIEAGTFNFKSDFKFKTFSCCHPSLRRMSFFFAVSSSFPSFSSPFCPFSLFSSFCSQFCKVKQLKFNIVIATLKTSIIIIFYSFIRMIM